VLACAAKRSEEEQHMFGLIFTQPKDQGYHKRTVMSVPSSTVAFLRLGDAALYICHNVTFNEQASGLIHVGAASLGAACPIAAEPTLFSLQGFPFGFDYAKLYH
jgi:hypothetical protein